MALGHFSYILEHIKIAAHALRRIRPKTDPRARPMQAKAPSLKDPLKVAEYQELKDFVEAYSGDSPPPLLVFGDSVFIRVATDDLSQKSIGEILGDCYREGASLIAGSGYHSGVFEQFSAVLATLHARPRIAIVPINLRTFSPTWDLNPLYQFRPEIGLLSKFEVNNPNYRLKNAVSGSGLDSRSVLLKCDGQKSITLGDFLDTTNLHPKMGSKEWKARLKMIFQLHYACPLCAAHRRLRSLKQTIRLLNRMGVTVYSYITPINYEAGLEYYGDSFVRVVEENISTLQREILSAMPSLPDDKAGLGFRLDNFALQFSRDVFFTPHNATEHLRFEGRDFISRRIFEAGRPFLQAGVF